MVVGSAAGEPREKRVQSGLRVSAVGCVESFEHQLNFGELRFDFVQVDGLFVVAVRFAHA